MGTRALISIDGKPFIATHWDGYPSGLGIDLLGCATVEEIVEAAKGHTIDSAPHDLIPGLNAERAPKLAKKLGVEVHRVEEAFAKGKGVGFGVYGPENYPVGDITEYGDFAEWQYDFRNGQWFFRELSGSMPDSLRAATGLLTMTKESLKKAEEQDEDE